MIEVSERPQDRTYRVRIYRCDEVNEYEFNAEDWEEIVEIISGRSESENIELRRQVNEMMRENKTLRDIEQAFKLICKLYAEK